ncbi:RDD family protein [Micromonospora craniellae]|uniref:RDD family protein n=1 Tax=Micromonospora craniellae TaxID=2294034 RepID=A0A372FXK2_9ACTN|nr:RDD family protein [Micromonospora craniellae]QOC90019.1 RDD family protein [Micromonospora craniellae]RFS45220.1 RDD family protein [Micromonospora craniellae]
MSVAPGWYVDPADPETRRYWDGEGWIGTPIPVDATPPEGPPPPEPEPTPEPEPATPAAGPAAPAGTPSEPGPATTWPGQPGHPGQQPGQFGGTPGPGGHPGQQPDQSGWPGAGGQQAGWPPGSGPPPGWPYPTWPGQPPPPRPHGLPLASFGARFAARLIDFGIVFVLNVFVNGFFVYRLAQEYATPLNEFWRRVEAQDTTTDPLPPAGDQAGSLVVVILLLATALWLAYEVPSMAAGGQTFGKRLLRVKAVPVEADAPLGFGRALRRWNTLGLPTLLWYCCGLGLLLQLIDSLSPLFDHPLRQALHDKRAQTVVVRLPRTPDDRADTPGDTP